MRVTRLNEEGDSFSYLLVMDQGDEAFSEIVAFARRESIAAASLTAIGAGTSVTLACFDPEIGSYVSTTFDEQVELASCVGDIATGSNGPVLHAHAVIGRQNLSALAGHLLAFHVFPTMEVVLTQTPAHLRRRIDPATGLALISVPEATTA